MGLLNAHLEEELYTCLESSRHAAAARSCVPPYRRCEYSLQYFELTSILQAHCNTPSSHQYSNRTAIIRAHFNTPIALQYSELTSILRAHCNIPSSLLYSVYRRPYFTGLRISTQTVSFITDNFSSFSYTKPDPHSTLYLLAYLWSFTDYTEDAELWLARAPYL